MNPTESFRAARDVLLLHRTDAAAASAAFTWPDLGPHFNWAVDWFDAMAIGNEGVALWIVDEDGSEVKVTFDRMRSRSNEVATWLHSVGVVQGDHVMLMLGNRLELWESMLAIMKLGAVVLPTTTLLSPADLADRLKRGDVSHVIADVAAVPKFRDIELKIGRIVVGGDTADWLDYSDSHDARGVSPTVVVTATDPCLIYFTSGTTSRPKMVVHTQRSYPVGHLSTLYWLGVRPGDIHLAISSPGWGKHAWSCFFAPWNAEATVFVYNYSRFSPTALRRELDRAGVTSLCAPPTVWRMLIQSHLGTAPHALSEIVSAGEPLNPEVIATVTREWNLTLRDGYGQTETTAIVGNPPGATVVPGAMGTALPGVAVTLIDPETGETGSAGEICIDLSTAPVNLMSGYYGDTERTESATADGYFRTGDVAVRSGGGTLTFVGRTDDIFKSSDFTISPFEVESVLLQHPAVAESAVVPAPDAVRQNVAKAYITLAHGWEPTAETAATIFAHSRDLLSTFERIRRIEFAELPKTSSGKIRRGELRTREQDAYRLGEAIATEWRNGRV
ncbi:AMP-binding protein [Rathayibacter toxicus]|uniref:AMP-dependent synthetase n=1 Tax=Rathayibacter toxicus TaxID=145458 RepID=A0A0C5BFU7_9MICO|nr:AMP-binding protein [Rathayibacter toxicus]AJM78271.1 AMP-dependent synthetase [Rathayibacter toxicus]ALS58284.1 AMP-dependent synthetase [Rathayibacter toxicus]KKM44383.1 AMP-dependent synthetase [Rathayibacter toxicus]PPG24886.1 AMP-dependent synthetase [Rathayibacter toxicus]PPG48340.1 AMP-dependent synthetase [Rathayibacter toxicus]